MALFFECMLECARKVIDTADIVRDGDLSTVDGSFDSSENLDCCEIADTHAATILGVHHTWSSIPLL